MNDLKIIEINDKLYKYGISDNIPEDVHKELSELMYKEALNDSLEEKPWERYFSDSKVKRVLSVDG